MKLKTLTIAALGTIGLAGTANAATYVVPGTANPFLAGASGGDSVVMNGYTDTAAANSPIAVAVTGGQTLSISATGSVSNCNCGLSGPNGAGGIASSGVTANGFTEIVNGYSNLPLNGLIGVFDNLALNNAFLIGTGAASSCRPGRPRSISRRSTAINGRTISGRSRSTSGQCPSRRPGH